MNVVSLILRNIDLDIDLDDILELVAKRSPLAATIISGIFIVVCLTAFGYLAYELFTMND